MQELKQIMALHGGRFENYYSRSTVSHIICSNLTDAKVKHFQRERCPTSCVAPTGQPCDNSIIGSL
jgi:DNA repair protein REV1